MKPGESLTLPPTPIIYISLVIKELKESLLTTLLIERGCARSSMRRKLFELLLYYIIL